MSGPSESPRQSERPVPYSHQGFFFFGPIGFSRWKDVLGFFLLVFSGVVPSLQGSSPWSVGNGSRSVAETESARSDLKLTFAAEWFPHPTLPVGFLSPCLAPKRC